MSAANTGPGDRGSAGHVPGGERVAAGRSVGPYRLVERLGRGGMGEVWRADDPTGAAGGTPRTVALKLLEPTLTARDPAVRARFAREVAALRKVSRTSGVPPLLDADVDADTPWLVTAYVAGPTLADHVGRHGPLADAALRTLGATLAEALAAIHAAGVVHRDLTPRNVVLGPDGPRLVDFGIAWFPDAVPVTADGSAVGTPTWMAPERLAGAAATSSSDVWSWGMVMAYAARGRPLEPATAGIEGVPDWLAPWVLRATATDPNMRPSAAELHAAMEAGRAADARTVDATQPLAGDRLPPTVPRDRADPPTLAFPTAEDRPGGGTAVRRRTAVRWGSAVAILGVAAGLGATIGLLASTLVTAVAIPLWIAVQFRRESQRPTMPVPCRRHGPSASPVPWCWGSPWSGPWASSSASWPSWR